MKELLQSFMAPEGELPKHCGSCMSGERPLRSILHPAVMLLTLSLMALAAVSVTGCMDREIQQASPLATVSNVDFQRYAGIWYEIARYPNRFQEDCFGSRATYSLRDDGSLSVLNECYESSFEGKLRSVKGRAKVVDPVTNAKLKVSFFWPFSGDYWIIDLGKEYEYAVIGHPGRKYLWILSRSIPMDEPLYEAILSRLRDKQYDTAKLIKTPQQ